jgi:hypothetical protein
MAQADSVPIAIRTPITGGTSKASPKHPRRSWYEVITGGKPIGPYIVTVFCATVVILVACAPWNFLLILGLLLSKDEVLRFWNSSRWGRSS